MLRFCSAGLPPGLRKTCGSLFMRSKIRGSPPQYGVAPRYKARTRGVGQGGEEEVYGEVSVVASPMMIRWGDGAGRHLDSDTVLMKAFVVVPGAS